jgi:hypothetical protein
VKQTEANEIALAVQLHVGHFETDPPRYLFMHEPCELAAAIHAVVAQDEKLTDEDLYRRPGMQPPDVAS